MSDQRGKVLGFGPLNCRSEIASDKRREVVPLGARAMDLLIVLLEQATRSSQENPDRARLADERCRIQVSLRVHISALRKALDRVIRVATISRTCPGGATAS